jgi:hypothetical protein
MTASGVDTPRLERHLHCILPVRMVASYVRESWLRRLRDSGEHHYVNTARCGPVVRNHLMMAIVGRVLDGAAISQELCDQVNAQIGHPFLPEAIDDLVAVLREMNIDAEPIAAADGARMLRA